MHINFVLVLEVLKGFIFFVRLQQTHIFIYRFQYFFATLAEKNHLRIFLVLKSFILLVGFLSTETIVLNLNRNFMSRVELLQLLG